MRGRYVRGGPLRAVILQGSRCRSGEIDAQEGEVEELRDSVRNVRQGFDMVRGKSLCGDSTLLRKEPMRLRSREAGSVNSSEMEARPNCG